VDSNLNQSTGDTIQAAGGQKSQKRSTSPLQNPKLKISKNVAGPTKEAREPRSVTNPARRTGGVRDSSSASSRLGQNQTKTTVDNQMDKKQSEVEKQFKTNSKRPTLTESLRWPQPKRSLINATDNGGVLDSSTIRSLDNNRLKQPNLRANPTSSIGGVRDSSSVAGREAHNKSKLAAEQEITRVPLTEDKQPTTCTKRQTPGGISKERNPKRPKLATEAEANYQVQ
jgi:hypothetical protein